MFKRIITLAAIFILSFILSLYVVSATQIAEWYENPAHPNFVYRGPGTSIGIGKDNPSAELDVVGNAKVSGNLDVNNGLTVRGDDIVLEGNRQIRVKNKMAIGCGGTDVDVCIQGVMSSPPNIAIRGSGQGQGDFLYINYNDDYSGGVHIGSRLGIDADPQPDYKLFIKGAGSQKGIFVDNNGVAASGIEVVSAGPGIITQSSGGTALHAISTGADGIIGTTNQGNSYGGKFGGANYGAYGSGAKAGVSGILLDGSGNPAADGYLGYNDGSTNYGFYSDSGRTYVNDRVGIRTKSPDAMLHIKANTAAALGIEGDGINHAYISWWPQGKAAGRKAWIGFGSSGTDDLSLDTTEGRGNINLKPGNSAVISGTLEHRGPYLQDYPNDNYDLWLQGGPSTQASPERNLGILGMAENSGDKLILNYNNEYSGGVHIQSNAIIDGNLRLVPNSPAPSCSSGNHEGTIFYDANTHQSMICTYSGGAYKWQAIGGSGTQSTEYKEYKAGESGTTPGASTTNCGPTVCNWNWDTGYTVSGGYKFCAIGGLEHQNIDQSASNPGCYVHQVGDSWNVRIHIEGAETVQDWFVTCRINCLKTS